MTVWCHLPTIFKRSRVLRKAGLLTLCVAIITAIFFNGASYAAKNADHTLGFQGRLLTSDGHAVPDGSYNIQFKIYQGGAGKAANDPGGSLKWTETYASHGSTRGVEVKNGYFSVNLGSQNPFGDSVDWGQNTLWLSMNVAGSSTDCPVFGAGSCVADGEMLPMTQITATPYALDAGKLDGMTADNFVQLGQGVQTDANVGTSSIFVNKTAAGNLLQLQSGGIDAFTLTHGGNIVFGASANHSISVGSAGNSAGSNLAVSAGGGTSGGTLTLQGGNASGTNGDGGDVTIDTGSASGDGLAGTINIGTANAGSINIGTNNDGGNTDITIGSGKSAASGTTAIQSKDDTTISTNGTQRARFSGSGNTLYVGNADTNGQATAGNDFTIQGTDSTGSNAQGGSLNVQAGSATNGDANGGNLTLSGGNGSGSGASGLVVITTPTFQAATSDTNCYTNGELVESSCTFTGSSVNNASVLTAGFSSPDQTATLPDPAIKTAGRVIYVTAADGSKDFTLRANASTNAEQSLTMHQNTTTTLLWNGSDWTTVGASTAETLQNSDSPAIKVNDDSKTTSESTANNDHADDSHASTTTSASHKDSAAQLGSIYYDTAAGKLQCYQTSGWGDCANSPDSFVSLSPEYAGAVVHNTGTGTMNTDTCSGTLHINDGSSSQPDICGDKETYNFYHWTSAEKSDQTRSIFVTYQLPSDFKKFISGSTSLTGRADSDADVTYQIYRNDGNGLTSCGSTVHVINSSSSWHKADASGDADPSKCDFSAGDSIVFKIDLTAKNDANAYVSNLDFAFSNH